MEADLTRWYGVDLRDRYRYERVIDGRGVEHIARRLSTRRIYVLVRHLPPESALASAERGRPMWTTTDHLIADLMLVTQALQVGRKAKDHPGRPKATKPAGGPDRPRKMMDAERRARAEQAKRNRREVTGNGG